MTQADSVHSTPPLNTSLPTKTENEHSLPKATADSLYQPTDVSPEALFTALGGLRQAAEAEIERLLTFLDQLDGDADIEPAGDEIEPELGSVAGRCEFDQSTWSDGVDGEPSLASPEQLPSNYSGYFHDRPYRDNEGTQVAWGISGTDDREGEHDGREPDVDDELSGDEDEPILGSFDRLIDQEHAWRQTKGSSGTWPVHDNCDAEVDNVLRVMP